MSTVLLYPHTDARHCRRFPTKEDCRDAEWDLITTRPTTAPKHLASDFEMVAHAFVRALWGQA